VCDLLQALKDAVTETECRFRPGNSLDQDREFITAEATHNVALADNFAKHGRDMLQKRVSNRVAKRIVHELKVVDIDKQQRQTLVVPLCARYSISKKTLKAASIRQARQNIQPGKSA
jgi:myosin-crossreactive antigen